MTNLPLSSIVSILLFFLPLLIHFKLPDSLRDNRLTPSPLSLVFMWFIVSCPSCVIFHCSPNKSAYRSSTARPYALTLSKMLEIGKSAASWWNKLKLRAQIWAGTIPEWRICHRHCLQIHVLWNLYNPKPICADIGSSIWKIKEQMLPSSSSSSSSWSSLALQLV